MNTLSAETYCKQGLAEIRQGDPKKAAALFRQAVELDRERNRKTPEMRYLSYYGLSLAQAGLSTQFALQACHKAVEKQRHDPLLHLNLGRVYNLAGKSVQAMQSFERGLALSPEHRQLRDELARLDRRSSPVLPALSRDHALNRWLGRMRASLRARQPGPTRSRRSRASA